MEKGYDFRIVGKDGEKSAYTSRQKREMEEEQEKIRMERGAEDSFELARWEFLRRTGEIR